MSYSLEKCLIDYTKCKDDKLIDFFPELNAFSEFKNAKSDNYIKIAISTADPDSPFIRIKDRDLMLKSIFEFIGIEIVTKKEKDFFNDVLIYEHVSVLECFGAYLRFVYDIDWTEYITTKQTYDVLVIESNRKREKEEELDDYVKRRVNIQAHLKKIGADLKNLEAKIFPDSKAAREISLLHNKKISTYAEKYAELSTHI